MYRHQAIPADVYLFGYMGAKVTGRTMNLLWLQKESGLAEGPLDRKFLGPDDGDRDDPTLYGYQLVVRGPQGPVLRRLATLQTPGPAFYAEEAKAALVSAADAFVFVASRRPQRREANLMAWYDLLEQLQSGGRGAVPIVVQATFGDAADARSIAELREDLELDARLPVIEACPPLGRGVTETLDAVWSLVPAPAPADRR